MVEGKTLNVFRDIVIIVGILVICLCEMQALMSRVQARNEQAMRFGLARQAIAQLDNAYKQMVNGKPVAEQVFRQNEMLIEYQKLLLTIAYVSVPARPAPQSGTPAPGGAAGAPAPSQAPPSGSNATPKNDAK